MNIVKIVKNYLSIEECDALNLWVKDAIASDTLSFGQNSRENLSRDYTLRYTSRFTAEKYEYPQLALDIYNRIETNFNLEQWHSPVHPHGKNGIVVSATLPGGGVYLHKDPMIPDTLETLRCNILTSETEGGLIHVGNEIYQLKKGDMMQYLVSRHEHSVETVIGNENDLRILWMFGWCVDGDEWEASIN